MSGMWEEVHRQAEYHPVSAEKPFRPNRENLTVAKLLRLLALGVDASALEEVFGVREITIRTWLCRSGMQSKKLQERYLAELKLVHVQLDNAFA